MRQRLTETSGDDVHPLDIHGRRVIDCHEQLVSILRNRLGQNHADFFAQPAPTAGSRSIVWYTTVPGEVAAVATLAPDEQQRLTQRAERILGDVEGLAAETVSDGPAGRTVAELLRAAAQVARGAQLFSVGGKVVTVLWGHGAANAERVSTPAAATREVRSAEAPVRETMQTVARDAHGLRSGTNTSGTAGRVQAAENATARWRGWLVPSSIALVVVALAAWAWKSDFLVPFAGGRDDLKAQIAAVEARNQTLESRISELKKKNPAPLKCVPEPVAGPRKLPPAKQSLRSPSGVSPVSRASASEPRLFAAGT